MKNLKNYLHAMEIFFCFSIQWKPNSKKVLGLLWNINRRLVILYVFCCFLYRHFLEELIWKFLGSLWFCSWDIFRELLWYCRGCREFFSSFLVCLNHFQVSCLLGLPRYRLLGLSLQFDLLIFLVFLSNKIEFRVFEPFEWLLLPRNPFKQPWQLLK